MCVPKTPDAPAPPTPRQAPRPPDAGVTESRTRADLMRRQTLSSMIFTGPSGALGAPPVAGKPVLGA